jgi:ubiquinone/menaquinone biosynthesis C-methylase UbiE
MSKPKTVSFFEKYAVEYDRMTDSAAREPKHRDEVRALINAFKPSSVLDAGCGTGLTAQLFAEQGVAVVGIDSSAEMVRFSSERCARFGALAEFQTARFESLPKSFGQRFDLIVCLANSLSGVPSIAVLTRSLKQFLRALKPGGSLVIQMLNPAVLQDGVPYPVKVSRHDQFLYHRYALRHGDTISLHIVRTDLSKPSPSFETFVHTYQPLPAPKLAVLLKSVGFGKVKTAGNLVLTEPFTAHSRDLVVIARR